uniref:GST C-terminal domain-containing protein n=1 Tax=Steinernema glaseri TaxID=37863 RepID=A0A1I7YQ41_9BILA
MMFFLNRELHSSGFASHLHASCRRVIFLPYGDGFSYADAGLARLIFTSIYPVAQVSPLPSSAWAPGGDFGLQTYKMQLGDFLYEMPTEHLKKSETKNLGPTNDHLEYCEKYARTSLHFYLH